MGRECKSNRLRQACNSVVLLEPQLVEWEKAGDKVVRRRFVAVDGDTLEVETTSIVPDGEPETMRLASRRFVAELLRTPSKERFHGGSSGRLSSTRYARCLRTPCKFKRSSGIRAGSP